MRWIASALNPAVPSLFIGENVMSNEELTAVEVDELLEKVADFEAQIAAAESERNALISRYQMKILAAQELCEQKCQPAREEVELLTEQLRRYAEANITGKRRSVKLPSGTLSFRKQAPRFFFENAEANAHCEPLLKFVKANGGKYLKIEESVDWANLKSHLQCIGEQVVYEDTGEIIDGMRAEIQPDKFTVKTS